MQRAYFKYKGQNLQNLVDPLLINPQIVMLFQKWKFRIPHTLTCKNNDSLRAVLKYE